MRIRKAIQINTAVGRKSKAQAVKLQKFWSISYFYFRNKTTRQTPTREQPGNSQNWRAEQEAQTAINYLMGCWCLSIKPPPCLFN